MFNRFLLATYDSLKDAMTDALKTPDWLVWATIGVIVILLVTAIFLIVACSKNPRKGEDEESDKTQASTKTETETETETETNSTNTKTPVVEEIKTTTTTQTDNGGVAKKTVKTTTHKKVVSPSETATTTIETTTTTQSLPATETPKATASKRAPKVKSIADAVEDKPKKTTAKKSSSTKTKKSK